MMLHGIIFVVHLSIGGDKLVFRYPHVTREKVSQETLVAFKQSTTKSSLHHSLPDPSPSTTSAAPAVERRERDINETDRQPGGWYDTPSVVLAPILTPKAQLCDLPFDLTIDDTRFIGHPSLVQKKVLKDAKFQNGQQDETSNDIEHDQSNNHNNSSNNNIHIYSNNNNNPSDISTLSSYSNTNNINTSNKNINNSDNNTNNINTNNENDNSSHTNGTNGPTIKMQDKRTHRENDSDKEDDKQGSDRKKLDHKDELRLFNIVFAVHASTSSQQANRFKWMAAQVASALLHEQFRCGYLIDQVNTMSTIRDEWLLEQTRKLAEANQANSNSRNKDSPALNQPSFFPRGDPALKAMSGGHYELTVRLLKASRLACELRDIFTGISSGNPGMGIRFNNWVTVPLSLQDPNAHSLFPLRPYHTLLLLDTHTHDSQIDRLPALKRLMEAAKPTKTFRELQTETDIPLAQMYRMAAHLVFWGRAKIINIMTKNNTYILSTQNPTTCSNLPCLWHEFSKTFPYFNLVEVLASFSVPKPLGEHVRLLQAGYSQYRDFVLVVTWLLQKDLIVQLHTYVHLMLSKEHTEANSSINNNSSNNNNNNNASRLSYSTTPVASAYKYTPPYPSCPQPLHSDELVLLEKLDDGTSTYQLLKRLAPYFRGRHTIEEIMWRENVSREQLTKLFQKHRNILIRVVHEGSNSNKDIMGIY